jgi:L-fuconolactonase
MSFPVIDAHQHIWDPNKAKYDWLGPEFAELNRVFEIDELLPQLAKLGIKYTVQVQSADNHEDTGLMRDCASKYAEVAAIVGFAPLDNPEETAKTIESWAKDDLMVGVRNLIHTKPDPKWLLRADVNESLALLANAGYTFDVVSVLPEQLATVSEISNSHPELRMVIDHMSKPPIGLSDDREWRKLMIEAAENPNVFAKISGLYSSTSDPASWTTEQIRPYFDFALETFGPKRLMYGGDWPVALIAGGYERVWNGLLPLFNSLSSADREQILGRTAAEFYKITPTRLGMSA